jgi:hypothetical protein
VYVTVITDLRSKPSVGKKDTTEKPAADGRGSKALTTEGQGITEGGSELLQDFGEENGFLRSMAPQVHD